MNKYGSQQLFLRAPNCYETTINPPNDLTLASGNWQEQIFNPVRNTFNSQANFTVKSIGVFSNFADGLVFKNASESLDVVIEVAIFNEVTVATGGTVQGAAGSNRITGAGTAFVVDFNVGDIIYMADFLGLPQYHFRITNIIDNTNMDVGTYLTRNVVPGGYTKGVLQGTASPVSFIKINQLNTLFDVDHFVNSNNFLIGAGVTDGTLILTAYVNNGIALSSVGPHDVDFLTKSINATFATDAIMFDVGAVFEL